MAKKLNALLGHTLWVNFQFAGFLQGFSSHPLKHVQKFVFIGKYIKELIYKGCQEC